MQRLIFIVVATLIGMTASQRKIVNDRDVHIWIRTLDSAKELTYYNISYCIPRPNSYCSYWTTTDFGFYTMSDSLFQEMLAAGLFIGHDYNRKYLY
jgi:hypothetical protein